MGKLWHNTQGQLSFLRHAMVAPPDVFTFEHALRKLAPLDGLHGSKSAVGLPNHAWLCLDLYDTLSRLAEAGHRPAVHQYLEHPAKKCPEVRTTVTCAEPILRVVCTSSLSRMPLPLEMNGNDWQLCLDARIGYDDVLFCAGPICGHGNSAH